MRIKILIRLKNQILEPQGKVIEQSLKSLGFEDFSNIRQGKLIEIDLPDSLNEEERSKRLMLHVKGYWLMKLLKSTKYLDEL